MPWCLPATVVGLALFVVLGQGWVGPTGIHFIRQTDSMAFVVHFREFGANLFAPGVLDLRNAPDHGAAAGEFPLHYWIIACLERTAGPMPMAIRWLSLGAVFLALVHFARTVSQLLEARFTGYAITLTLVGSPVLAYYTFNHLPDALVFALVLSGWSLVMPGLVSDRPRFRWAALVLFTLAGAIKAPAAMHLIAWTVILALHRPREPLGVGKASALLLGIALVGAWHLYARWYNSHHGTHYFLTWAEPVWAMTPDEQRNTWLLITDYWWTKYLHPSAWHMAGVLCLLLLLRWRHLAQNERAVLALLWASATAFVLLFFRKFADHDYYFLTLLPAIAWTLVFGTKAMFPWLRKPWARTGSAMVWGGLAIASLLLGRLEIHRRTTGTARDHARVAPYLSGIHGSIAHMGLPTDARVVVLGDSSANGALTAVARMGWAFPGYPAAPEPSVRRMLDMGATHLLVIDHPTPELTGHRHLTGTDHWDLWELTR